MLKIRIIREGFVLLFFLYVLKPSWGLCPVAQISCFIFFCRMFPVDLSMFGLCLCTVCYCE